MHIRLIASSLRTTLSSQAMSLRSKPPFPSCLSALHILRKAKFKQHTSQLNLTIRLPNHGQCCHFPALVLQHSASCLTCSFHNAQSVITAHLFLRTQAYATFTKAIKHFSHSAVIARMPGLTLLRHQWFHSGSTSIYSHSRNMLNTLASLHINLSFLHNYSHHLLLLTFRLHCLFNKSVSFILLEL